ncbi:MAG: YihA family ribosome biogenesis GTP-binding protein, partial [Acetatifactor sp.]
GENYLHRSRQLKAVFLLIDIRHKPSEKDRIMYDWIKNHGYQPIIIATKLDKINRSQVQKQVKLLKETLKAEQNVRIVPFSATTKQGREEIYEIIEEILQSAD